MVPSLFPPLLFLLYVIWRLSDSEDALWIAWDIMQWNILLFMINVCHAGCLLYALYGICHQYSTDISAWLDMIGIISAESAKRSIFQQLEYAHLWFKFSHEIPLRKLRLVGNPWCRWCLAYSYRKRDGTPCVAIWLRKNFTIFVFFLKSLIITDHFVVLVEHLVWSMFARVQTIIFKQNDV